MFTNINEDVYASFLFIGDLNDHHQECMCSTTTNRHSVAALILELHPVVISW